MVSLRNLRAAITFHSIAVAGCSEPGSFLAFADSRLIAVVARRPHADREGARWYVEAGFGPCAEAGNYFFDSAEEAQGWVRRACQNA